MTTELQDPSLQRTETFGNFVISGAVHYLPDVQRWEPKIHIARLDGRAQEFIVPCGPECYRKTSDDAFRVGWATARQWLDGGKIPWKARPSAT